MKPIRLSAHARDELNKGIADERGVRLEVYRWETDAYPAFHPRGPQGQIDSCLRIDDCDLINAPAANGPAEEVRTAARDAAEKYADKLRYFA